MIELPKASIISKFDGVGLGVLGSGDGGGGEIGAAATSRVWKYFTTTRAHTEA